MLVYLDNGPENMVPHLGLDAETLLGDRWNGWLRPVATADALARFVDAWRANDPNGVWGVVFEESDGLRCTRSDDDDYSDKFPLFGISDEGSATYDLTGWAWIQPSVGH